MLSTWLMPILPDLQLTKQNKADIRGLSPKKIWPVKRSVKRTIEFSQPNLTGRFNRSFNRPYFFLGEPPELPNQSQQNVVADLMGHPVIPDYRFPSDLCCLATEVRARWESGPKWPRWPSDTGLGRPTRPTRHDFHVGADGQVVPKWDYNVRWSRIKW